MRSATGKFAQAAKPLSISNDFAVIFACFAVKSLDILDLSGGK